MKTAAAVFVFVFLLLSGLFGAFPWFFEAQAGVIKGSVLNETLNKKGMQNLEVTLFRYQNNAATEINRTRAGHEGIYVFKDIAADENKKYYISVDYKDVSYYSELFDFQQKDAINLDVSVFEPTGRDDNIHIKMHHILVNAGKEGLEFKEIMVVENTGKTTYIGKPRLDSGPNQTLRISLPEEASGLRPINPSLVHIGTGLIDTAEIIPGTKRILFSYRVYPETGSYQFEKTFHQKTEKFNMIFPEKDILVKSDQLEIKASSEHSGRGYVYLEGENLAKKAHIEVELRRFRTTDLFKWTIAGLMTLLMVTAFSLSLLKAKKEQI